MIPYICDGNIINKSLQPKIAINDCISCSVTEEVNGIYECVLVLPSQSENLKYVSVGNCIYLKVNPLSECQFFRIYKITVSLTGNTNIYGEHIRYILNYYPCPMITNTSIMLLLMNIPLINYGTLPFVFNIDTDITNSSKRISVDSAKSIGAVLSGSENSIIGIFGGEWEFNNYECKLLKSRGFNKNVVLQYGYDINDCNREIEIQNSYTHFFPYYEWTLNDGSIATITLTHKDLESKYPDITADDLIKIDNNYNSSSVMKVYMLNLATVYNLDLTVGYWNGLDIRSMAENWLEEHRSELLGISISTTLDFAYIKQNIALNQCMLGDIVRLRISQLNIETTAKIKKAEYDSLNECYKSIDIGTIKSRLDVSISDNSKNIKRLNVKTTREITRIANTIRQ